MTMFMLNGQPLPLDTPFTAGDIQYPANWLRLTSLEEKLAIGITEVDEAQTWYDDRFYWGPGNPKDLDTLKANWTTNVNQIAYTLLAPSDWMVTRKIETGADIPADWSAYRDQVRIDCGLNKDLITQATDVEALVSVVTGLKWPTDPNFRGV
ncbi:MAG: hypothetical protein AMS22_05550 [Thiotrichales bacterium SG8_50]|nr:MAG: hypothetical protein AMS22_05550 [Thiotrichales bacterium SG8_50]